MTTPLPYWINDFVSPTSRLIPAWRLTSPDQTAHSPAYMSWNSAAGTSAALFYLESQKILMIMYLSHAINPGEAPGQYVVRINGKEWPQNCRLPYSGSQAEFLTDPLLPTSLFNTGAKKPMTRTKRKPRAHTLLFSVMFFKDPNNALTLCTKKNSVSIVYSTTRCQKYHTNFCAYGQQQSRNPLNTLFPYQPCSIWHCTTKQCVPA